MTFGNLCSFWRKDGGWVPACSLIRSYMFPECLPILRSVSKMEDITLERQRPILFNLEFWLL